MKIGIITLSGNFNYGNRLQNYALQNSIEKLGYEVETIVPIDKESKIKKFFRDKLGLVRSIILFNYSERKFRKKSFSKMQEIKEKQLLPFTEKYLNNYYLDIDNDKELIEKCKGFDFFVIGSDQVWNPNYIKNYDFYFARFSEKEKRTSYAASFGVSEIPSKYSNIYKKNLNEMGKVTVREVDGSNIVEYFTNKEAQVVLDPTLLLEKNEWLDFTQSEEIKDDKKEPYILVYFLGEDMEEYLNSILNFANSKKLRIISIMGDYYNQEQIVPNPKNFVNLINNAEYFFTDSFHGVVFSLIMNTKFLAFRRGNINSRIETLLKTCDIEENYNPILENQINPIIDQINFSKINSILSIEREKSKEALSNLFQ